MPMISRPARAHRSHGTARAVGALILREMATTYGRSPGGYLWAVMEPLAGIALLTILFSLALSAPPLGTSFALFYASGYMLFVAYQNIANKMTVALRFSKPLLNYPAIRFTDPFLARFVLNGLTECTVVMVILGALLAMTGTGFDLDWADVIGALALALALGGGIGVMNSALIGLFPLYERVWVILTRPLFVVSSIFYLFEIVPHPYDRLLWFNPLVHVIAIMRRGIYPSYAPDFVSVPYVAGIAAGALIIGLVLLHRWYRHIINN